MKVVLFCGGQGMRMRDYSEAVPKPMVRIGDRPILWNIMKYYAHFGHKDFILCLGFKGALIKEFFLNYEEWVSNDFILSNGRELRLFNKDIQDWKVTFVDTGLHASVGERLKAVKPFLDGEKMFLANYADGLTDLWLPDMIERFRESENIAAFLAVSSPQSFHVARIGEDDSVTDITPLSESDLWINGGFFVLRSEIFDYMRDGEELVSEPFQRLIRQKKLLAHRHMGFWRPMDTFKDKQALDEMYESGLPPWEVWKQGRHVSGSFEDDTTDPRGD